MRACAFVAASLACAGRASRTHKASALGMDQLADSQSQLEVMHQFAASQSQLERLTQLFFTLDPLVGWTMGNFEVSSVSKPSCQKRRSLKAVRLSADQARDGSAQLIPSDGESVEVAGPPDQRRLTIDVLRSDIPSIFRKEPSFEPLEEDFSIVDQDEELLGMKGLKALELMLNMVRAIGAKFFVKEDIQVEAPDMESFTRRWFPRKSLETRWKVQLSGVKPFGMWQTPLDFEAEVLFYFNDNGKLGFVQIGKVFINGLMELQSWPNMTLPFEEVMNLEATRDAAMQEYEELVVQLDNIREVLRETTEMRAKSNIEYLGRVKAARQGITVADKSLSALQPLEDQKSFSDFKEKESFKEAIRLLEEKKVELTSEIQRLEEAEEAAKVEFQEEVEQTKQSISSKAALKELSERDMKKAADNLDSKMRDLVDFAKIEEWVEKLRKALTEAEQEEEEARKAEKERIAAAEKAEKEQREALEKKQKERLAALAQKEEEQRKAEAKAERQRRAAAREEWWQEKKRVAKKAVLRVLNARKRARERAAAERKAKAHKKKEDRIWKLQTAQAEKERKAIFKKEMKERKLEFKTQEKERKARFKLEAKKLQVSLKREREEKLAATANRERARREAVLQRLDRMRGRKKTGVMGRKSVKKEAAIPQQEKKLIAEAKEEAAAKAAKKQEAAAKAAKKQEAAAKAAKKQEAAAKAAKEQEEAETAAKKAAAAAKEAEGTYQKFKEEYDLVKDLADKETRADLEARLQELFILEDSLTKRAEGKVEKVSEVEDVKAINRVEEDVETDLDEVIGTLKIDIPRILHQAPHWDLFAKGFKVIDKTGASIKGLEDNKKLLSLLHNVSDKFVKEDYINLDGLDDRQALTRPIFPRRSFTADVSVKFMTEGCFGLNRKAIDFDLKMDFHLDDENRLDYMRVNKWLANGQVLDSRPQVNLSRSTRENLRIIESWANKIKPGNV